MSIFYVSTAGNDSTGNGSQIAPWKTLAKATSTVTTVGDIIHVNAGTYTEGACSLKAGVSIEGDSKATTILKSSVTGQWIPFIQMESPNSTNGNQSISNITIDGNTNTTGNESGTWVGVWITGRSNVSIYDCIIKNFYAYGAIFQGNNLDGITAKNWTSGPYATGNKFYNNDATNCAGIIPSIQGGSGALGIGWQEGMLIHHNNISTTQRPVSKNGWPIKFISNGYLKGVKIYDNTLKKSPFQGYQPYSPPDWDFCIEFFNVQGLELYNNYIQGSVDVNYIYKGSYQYGLWAHHNTFDNPGNFNHWEGGFILEFKADHVLIENNIINNRSLGVTYNTRGINNNGGENNYACNYGGSIGGCSGIINNVIRNNVFSNLYQAGGVPGGIVTITEGTDDVQIDGLYIYNNVFSGKSSGATYNGLDFGGIGSGASVKNVYIRNNIFQNFQSNPIVKQSGGSQSNIQITNNDFYNNGDNTISWTGATQANNQTVNPLFVSATDFHLQPTSPLIDDGFTPLLLPSYAVSVPFNGSAPDLGAFETGNSVPVPCTSHVYSAWGPCVNGQQTRTVVSSSPSGCTGGVAPILSQACVVVNQPPVVNAGTDKTLILPINSVPLSGSASDSDGTIASIQWTQSSGPATAIISSPTTASTTVSALVQGTYVFRLTATDNLGLTAFDEATVVVNPQPVNQPPTANAGADKIVILPANSVTLEGSGIDGDGTVVAYQWQDSNGGVVGNTASLALTNLVAGVYNYTLTVIDNLGATGTDNVQVTVSTSPYQDSTKVIVYAFANNAAAKAAGLVVGMLYRTNSTVKVVY